MIYPTSRDKNILTLSDLDISPICVLIMSDIALYLAKGLKTDSSALIPSALPRIPIHDSEHVQQCHLRDDD